FSRPAKLTERPLSEVTQGQRLGTSVANSYCRRRMAELWYDTPQGEAIPLPVYVPEKPSEKPQGGMRRSGGDNHVVQNPWGYRHAHPEPAYSAACRLGAAGGEAPTHWRAVPGLCAARARPCP